MGFRVDCSGVQIAPFQECQQLLLFRGIKGIIPICILMSILKDNNKYLKRGWILMKILKPCIFSLHDTTDQLNCKTDAYCTTKLEWLFDITTSGLQTRARQKEYPKVKLQEIILLYEEITSLIWIAGWIVLDTTGSFQNQVSSLNYLKASSAWNHVL